MGPQATGRNLPGDGEGVRTMNGTLKPLEWRRYRVGAFIAETIVGRYRVEEHYWWKQDTAAKKCGSINAGKEAAWADYQAEIAKVFTEGDE